MIYSKKYAHGSHFVVACCGMVQTDFINVTQGYFTPTGQPYTYDCHIAREAIRGEATMKYMGKWFNGIHQEPKLHNHKKAQ